ncbi:MAG: biotin/lipoate--protein ligase family protein, partial [Candidatus Puniceispirillum sp.]
MSIYYTPDPDDYEGEPRLPPLLRAQAVEAEMLDAGDHHSYALAQAAQVDPGTVFYAEAGGIARFSVVLAPDVPTVQAAQMFHAMMVGVGDAIGALAPPEVEVNYLFPGYVLLNRGRAGTVQVSIDPAAGLQDEP